MIFYDSPQATVTWNEENKVVVLQWKSFAKGEQYRIPLNKVLELAVQKRTNKALYDSRHLAVISPDDQEWVAQEWYLRSMEAGITHSALIVPHKAIAKSSANRMLSGMDISNPTQEFHDIDEAFHWLATLK
ncbi:hypothetical protein [Paenibacillus amylolyticus]|uniref:STAS/SEC14 domain-containing protein n=1 Tax=Paenibacillus amylolyticus TaxID=1451 RepID=A0A117I3S4_PAEAM|nr:hypothetical protein [Paenibacillus amylolyticus]GAS85730.1 unknown protein [Paenibacillus amylolyticus]